MRPVRSFFCLRVRRVRPFMPGDARLRRHGHLKYISNRTRADHPTTRVRVRPWHVGTDNRDNFTLLLRCKALSMAATGAGAVNAAQTPWRGYRRTNSGRCRRRSQGRSPRGGIGELGSYLVHVEGIWSGDLQRLGTARRMRLRSKK